MAVRAVLVFFSQNKPPNERPNVSTFNKNKHNNDDGDEEESDEFRVGEHFILVVPFLASLMRAKGAKTF
jgi:hypothetical protein